MDYYEKTLSSERVFEGRVVKLRVDQVLLPDGKTGTREVVEHNGGVAVVAVKDDKIVLVRQFRKPLEKVLLEIPAGKIDKEENPYDCAVRELEEETGLIPVNLKPLTAIYTAPGFSSEVLHLYYADSFKEGSLNRDQDEFMDVVCFELGEVLDMIRAGEIKDAKTICGVLMYAQFNTLKPHRGLV